MEVNAGRNSDYSDKFFKKGGYEPLFSFKHRVTDHSEKQNNAAQFLL